MLVHTNSLSENTLRSAIAFEGGVSRRLALAYLAALASLPVVAQRANAARRIAFADNPFSVGVASGDPDSNSVLIWTRLAPKPFEPAGGMPPEAVEVHWRVAEDDAMKHVVAQGKAIATPQLGHSVHVEVAGLKPDRWYWYDFAAGDARSSVGRTRTMPAADVLPERLKFAFVSCQHYEQGLYTAYEQMAKDEPDLVCHLGDYIYEYKGADNRVRKHLGDEIKSLDDYRIRYSQYRSDPLLSGMHAASPWLVTFDDHEFDNNYANHISEEKDVDPVDFLLRRANAYQAYYEMMPLRAQSLPTGPDMRLYRGASFGRLADFHVLDTRQYRTDQPNGDKPSPLNEAAWDRDNTLLGVTQRNWLLGNLLKSTSTWNILAQQIMIAQVGFPNAQNELMYSMDQWCSALHERQKLLEFMADRRVPNPVVLTGDIHANWANDVRVDDHKPETPIVATEFVGTSISSGGNGVDKIKQHDGVMANNPGVHFFNAERGYVRCTVTPKLWTSDYVVCRDVTKPGGQIVVRETFVTEAGKPGIQKG